MTNAIVDQMNVPSARGGGSMLFPLLLTALLSLAIGYSLGFLRHHNQLVLCNDKGCSVYQIRESNARD